MLIEGYEVTVKMVGRTIMAGVFEILIKTPRSIVFGNRVQSNGHINELQAFQYFQKSFKEFWIEADSINEKEQSAIATINVDKLGNDV